MPTSGERREALTRNPLIANDFAIEDLRSSLREGESGLKYLPMTLKRVLREESWRERIVQDTGEIVGFDSFAEFVTADPLAGLGSDIEQIKKLLEHDTEALLAYTDATIGKHGGPRRGESAQTKSSNTTLDRGKAYALRKLRKAKKFDLLSRVDAGELSPHAAMVQAGFRPKTATVRLDDPERLAQALARKLDPDDLRALVKFLAEVVGA